MKHSHSDSDKTQIFGIAALAAGVGAMTALLLAKKDGRETREAIRLKASRYKSKLKDPITDISEAAENAKDVVNQAKDNVKKVVDDKLHDK